MIITLFFKKKKILDTFVARAEVALPP